MLFLILRNQHQPMDWTGANIIGRRMGIGDFSSAVDMIIGPYRDAKLKKTWHLVAEEGGSHRQ